MITAIYNIIDNLYIFPLIFTRDNIYISTVLSLV
jgi:hypothetical protein